MGVRLARWDRADEFATGLDLFLGHYERKRASAKGREGCNGGTAGKGGAGGKGLR